MNIKKLLTGGAWFLGFSIFAKIIAFFNKIYLTRMLSVAHFGLFVSMFSLFGIVLTFSSLGLNSSIVKFIPHYRVKKQYGKITSVILSILKFELINRLFIFIILWILSPWLAEHYFKAYSTEVFRFFSCIVLTELISRNVKPFFKSFKKTIILGWIEFLTPALYGLFFIISFKFIDGIYAPILSYLIVSVIISIVFGIIAFRTFNFFKYKAVEEWLIFKKMIAFGIPLVIANTGGVFISYFDTIMLTSLSTLDKVGIYNIALSSALLLSFIASAISITLIPTVAELKAIGDHKDIYKGLCKLYKYYLIVLSPIIFVTIVWGKYILQFVYGLQYSIGYWAFRILLIGMMFVILNNLNIRVLIGMGDTKVIAKVTWISAGLNVILNIPFIMWWGYVGAAIATSISYLCQMILTHRQVKKLLDEKNE